MACQTALCVFVWRKKLQVASMSMWSMWISCSNLRCTLSWHNGTFKGL